MGIVSVIITFILSAILYYQGMQEQFSHELQHLNSVMAGAVSTDDEDRSREYLERIYDDNGRTIHIVWLDSDGAVIYDSDNKDEDYKSGPEVKQAMENGKAPPSTRTPTTAPRATMPRKRLTDPSSAFPVPVPFLTKDFPPTCRKSSSFFSYS